jgi:hypothetical protein
MEIMHLVSRQQEQKIKVRILVQFWREIKSLAKSWERYDTAMNMDIIVSSWFPTWKNPL